MRLIVATIAGTLVMFFLGWLVYGILLADYMGRNTIEYPGLTKAPMPDMVPLVLANVVIATLITVVFAYWAGIRTFAAGLVGGAFIMFMISLYFDLSFYSMFNFFRTSMVIVLDVIAATVIGAVAGGVIGLVLGKMTPAAAAAD